MYTLKPVITGDGSSTFFIPELNEHYHSTFGAVQESNHIFINSGLIFFLQKNQEMREISIFEMGFGTGLNAFLTWMAIRNLNLKVKYTTIEKYPIDLSIIQQLNLKNIFKDDYLLTVFEEMHTTDWENKREFDNFILNKIQTDITNYQPTDKFNLVYFDAFAPDIQPELWSKNIFEKIYQSLYSGSILTTYSAKGTIRRLLSDIGFQVEKIQGPPGKRHILRAFVK